jgi:hypothetical protein
MMFDHKSAELHELQEMEEEQLAKELGRCPGPSDLWNMPLERRGFLKAGVGGALSSLIYRWLEPAANAQAPKPPAKARQCILLWMNGGPSHMDTWDPKPGTSNGGPTKSIRTRVPGLEIAESLPAMAEVADRISVIRSMTSKEGNHDRARYLMHTGYVPNPTIQHPSLGAWACREIADPDFDLPSFVSISGPSLGAGFLGVQYGPFVVNNPSAPLANAAYSRDVNFGRFESRMKALNMLEDRFASETGDVKVKGKQAVYDKAVKMMHSPRLKAFHLDEEPESVKAAYGSTDFGRGCLMARRLVESGVKFVEVMLNGWDTHENNFERVAKLNGTYDGAFATLIKDLEARNLLDSTLIVWMGEFGRTPKINPREGRDHFPGAWSAVLAGGGARRGYVHGATNAEGTRPAEKPLATNDYFATIASLLGMNPEKTYMTPVGRPIAITEKGTPVRELMQA